MSISKTKLLSTVVLSDQKQSSKQPFCAASQFIAFTFNSLHHPYLHLSFNLWKTISHIFLDETTENFQKIDVKLNFFVQGAATARKWGPPPQHFPAFTTVSVVILLLNVWSIVTDGQKRAILHWKSLNSDPLRPKDDVNYFSCTKATSSTSTPLPSCRRSRWYPDNQNVGLNRISSCSKFHDYISFLIRTKSRALKYRRKMSLLLLVILFGELCFHISEVFHFWSIEIDVAPLHTYVMKNI